MIFINQHLKTEYESIKVDKGKLSERIGRKVMDLRQQVAMIASLPALFLFIKVIIYGNI